jgi:hypothetical protein
MPPYPYPKVGAVAAQPGWLLAWFVAGWGEGDDDTTTDGGVVTNRPLRDGHMTLVRSPDGISIKLPQKGDALRPKEPWGIHGQHREERSKRCALGSRDFV